MNVVTVPKECQASKSNDHAKTRLQHFKFLNNPFLLVWSRTRYVKCCCDWFYDNSLRGYWILLYLHSKCAGKSSFTKHTPANVIKSAIDQALFRGPKSNFNLSENFQQIRSKINDVISSRDGFGLRSPESKHHSTVDSPRSHIPTFVSIFKRLSSHLKMPKNQLQHYQPDALLIHSSPPQSQPHIQLNSLSRKHTISAVSPFLQVLDMPLQLPNDALNEKLEVPGIVLRLTFLVVTCVLRERNRGCQDVYPLFAKTRTHDNCILSGEQLCLLSQDTCGKASLWARS